MRKFIIIFFSTLIIGSCVFFIVNIFLKHDLLNINIHVIDVGQGSATLIENNKQLVLIDTGYDAIKFQTYITNFMINEQKYNNEIDYLIITHPDADHISSFEYLFLNFNIKHIYLPFISWSENTVADYHGNTPKTYRNSKTYENAINTFINLPTIKWEYIFEEKTKIDKNIIVYNYTNFNSKTWNDYSPIILINYDKNKYVCISGDASKIIEEKFAKKFSNKISSTIYIMGHHGSDTSSSDLFLTKINPILILISVNDPEGKKYGLPNINAIRRAYKFTNNIYDTLKNGTMVFSTIIQEYTNLIKTTSGWAKKGGDLLNII